MNVHLAIRLALGFLVLRALQTLLGDDIAVWTIIVAIPAGYAIGWSYHRLYAAIDRWRATTILRRLPESRRLEVLEQLPPTTRQLIRNGLLRDGGEESAAGVERFPFPARRVVWNARIQLACLVVAAGAMLAVISLALQPWIRWILFAAGLLVGALAFGLERRQRMLESVIEVSLFQVALQYPDGERVALPFRQPLIFINEPRWRRARIAPADGSYHMTLHYGRMASIRMLSQVLVLGGFRSDA